MDIDKRKNLRLKGFDYSQQGCYFLTICTQNRKSILSDVVGDGLSVPQIMLSRYGIISEAYIHEIHNRYPTANVSKYIIMPNHIHILLMLAKGTENQSPAAKGTDNPSPTIVSIIAWFKYQTTKKINEVGNKFEKVWQRSFHDHIIRNEQDYLDHWLYIDNNTAKWTEDEYYSERRR